MTAGRAWRAVCGLCGVPTDGRRCATCGGCAVLDLAPLTAAPSPERASGIWRHAAMLPATTTRITLGEGNTPSVEWGGAPRLWLKLESMNPTLSFKDRGMALAVSAAVDAGAESLVVASTGNAAASAAAYAAAAGLGCRIIVGDSPGAAEKVRAAARFGARVARVDGDYSDAYRRAEQAEGPGVVNVTTTYQNPITAEAYRGIAAELVADLGHTPDRVVVPVGAGPLLRGIAQGFADLVAVGAARRVPAMIAVQSAAVAPLAAAWAAGDTPEQWEGALEVGGRWSTTRAGAIADALRGYERQGLITLAAVAATRGRVVTVTEEQIAAAEAALFSAGIWVEPSAAAALSAASRFASTKVSTVAVLTGHGAKAA